MERIAPWTISAAIVGPTYWTWVSLGSSGPTLPARSFSNLAWPLGSMVPVRMMKDPVPVCCTTPLTPSLVTADWTWFSDGLPWNLSRNSVPPWKSMPSRKPWVAIETMPGMMITSEARKNQFRAPMMLSVRGRGGVSAPGPDLLFEAFEDQHVGVDRHSDAEDEAGQAGQREGDRPGLEERDHDSRVGDQGHARQEAGQAVVGDHEEDHDGEADEARRH